MLDSTKCPNFVGVALFKREFLVKRGGAQVGGQRHIKMRKKWGRMKVTWEVGLSWWCWWCGGGVWIGWWFRWKRARDKSWGKMMENVLDLMSLTWMHEATSCTANPQRGREREAQCHDTIMDVGTSICLFYKHIIITP